nr:hypothetical protein [Lachnospiraceae bacterium]
MTDEEKAAEVQQLRARLKELSAVPRSDWHRAFERILRFEALPYGSDVEIRVEQELGIDPPRTDYLILDDRKRMMHGKSIFSIFRGHNIVEYKNPNDSLNERVISKAIGYAGMYIGTARYEHERQRDDVSISIFRSEKNQELFRKMQRNGTLIQTDIPGIYHVVRLTDLPFQIVITSELEGDEYAAYRALSYKASERDVELVAEQRKRETNPELDEMFEKLMEFYEIKNPGIIQRIAGGDENMSSILMEALKPQIEERDQERDQKRDRTNLIKYVLKGYMSITDAAHEAGMSVENFRQQM